MHENLKKLNKKRKILKKETNEENDRIENRFIFMSWKKKLFWMLDIIAQDENKGFAWYFLKKSVSCNVEDSN